MEADRPYSTEFPTSIASSRESTGITATTGPKTSSREMRIAGEQSPKIVGSWKKPWVHAPPSSRWPPQRSFARSPFAISTYFSTVRRWLSLMQGPMSMPGSRPLPTRSAFVRSTKRAANSG